VFLVDRREPALGRRIRELEAALEALALPAVPRSSMRLPAAEKPAPSGRGAALTIRRLPGRGRADGEQGLWLSDVALERAVRRGPRLWWALPPVVWPDEEKNLLDRVERALKAGARRFVLNQPWQIVYFEGRRHLELWAGPFCNAANPPAVEALAAMGFTGVVASPELDREALAALPRRSRIPMGVVIHGNWPLCLSRVLAEPVAPAEPFSSPMGEQAWVRRHDGTYWVYPNWCLDLQGERGLLEGAGYRLFLHLAEPAPKGVRMKPRPGKWNWDIGLR
jgi:putative protease